MPVHSSDSPSPVLHPSKRVRRSPVDQQSPTSPPPSAGTATSPTTESPVDGPGAGASNGAGKPGHSSSFRNVSACNRCRLRKNRCDQRLPSCASCEKANVACVGYDPITKKEIPRSYVFYLETRVTQLETLLSANNISFPTAQNLEYCSRPGQLDVDLRSPVERSDEATAHAETMDSGTVATRVQNSRGDDTAARLQRLVSKSGMQGMPGAASPRYLGSATGVSFARVVFAAVQSSVSDQKSNSSDRGSVRPYKPIAGNAAAGTGTSMRDSFFGLHTKPTIHPAPFPEKALGQQMVTLYFEHANPQIPVLHKGAFMHMFEQAYAEDTKKVRGPRELYMLNMVFAIGGGIIMGDLAKGGKPREPGASMGLKQAQPEEYHASAIVHLEACLSNSGGGLEELQAVLLLANFALLRPVPPGLWYIIGVAVRLAVDLGLHYEDGKDIDSGLSSTAAARLDDSGTKERGRREYVRDLRRRLWWCTYSLDRLVSICVGRPFGISDQVITTEFPSLLEDRYITPAGFLEVPPDIKDEPTYKRVAHHYFRLRLLQSEILQVLQFQQAQMARAGGQNAKNPYMHTYLPSPFLSKFESFKAWRSDIDQRLYQWKASAPTRRTTGVAFSTEFLDLNYWQAIIMLYRQSLSVPAMFEGEYHVDVEVNNRNVFKAEAGEDEDRVYLKVAEAGQKILRLYRQLHVVGLINYTYLATHHLFMGGISYLYAIWHSPVVRSQLTMDEVDFTILAATSVFSDLIEKCPPAEACRDAFDRTAKATIKMINSTGGFGQPVPPRARRPSGSKPTAAPDRRSNWAARGDAPAAPGHANRLSIEQLSQHTGQLEMDAPEYPYSAAAVQRKPEFSTSDMQGMKPEPDDFAMTQRTNAPHLRRNSPGSANTPATPDIGAIDPSLMPSPTGRQNHPASPAVAAALTPTSPSAAAALNSFLAVQQQQQQQPSSVYSPGAMSLSDLQGMEFLHSVGGMNGGVGAVPGGGGGDGAMDFGFGLGWEGMHHDFSDGQQLDLFDGFFFGGQQGGGTNGVGMGSL